MRSKLTVVGVVVVFAALPIVGTAARARSAVNIAVDAAATASSEAAGAPAGLATDGNAATAWCPTSMPATLTIDLGRATSVAGFGITLAGPADGTVDLSVASSPRSFLAIGPAFAVATGTPSWIPTPGRGPVTVRFVRVQVSGASAICVGELRVLGESATAPRAVGHDLSFAVQEAAIGNGYTDRGLKALPEQILADHGANFARLRLWLAPPGGYSNLASVLAMAARAHAAGMQILLDFHYSDFWADPATQNTPTAWQGQDLATLATTVRTYTRDVLTALAAQGTPAAMVQIGNEIR
ncbi:MAG TPA: glycosyl hydrolase 53 family protein, partial [Kofleriaceae bacterium]|nr:glycosyl hydrolase 53 family protein [Kofleriaceae bacterium]